MIFNRFLKNVNQANVLYEALICLKAVYKDIRAGFNGNLHDCLDENVIAHALYSVAPPPWPAGLLL